MSSDKLMERSPAAGGCAPESDMWAILNQKAHLLSVNRDSLGEGIIKDVSFLSDLKRFTLRIVLGPKVFMVNHTNGDLEAKHRHDLRWLLEGHMGRQQIRGSIREECTGKFANSRSVVLINRKPKAIVELVDDLRQTKGET